MRCSWGRDPLRPFHPAQCVSVTLGQGHWHSKKTAWWGRVSRWRVSLGLLLLSREEAPGAWVEEGHAPSDLNQVIPLLCEGLTEGRVGTAISLGECPFWMANERVPGLRSEVQ